MTSVEQETYEKYFYGTEHWNYFTNDEDLGPVILSIKQETLNGRDQFRILVRAISYTVHGLIPASCVFADRYDDDWMIFQSNDKTTVITVVSSKDFEIYVHNSFNCFVFVFLLPIQTHKHFFRYNREEVVRSLGKEVNLNPPLTLGQLPDTPEELLKLDQVSVR